MHKKSFLCLWSVAIVAPLSQAYDIKHCACLHRVHSHLDLIRVSGMAYTKSRLTFDLSKCKQSGPYELFWSCRLTTASKRITRCVFAKWKRVQDMCPLARTDMLLIKFFWKYIFNFFSEMIIFITTKAFLKP